MPNPITPAANARRAGGVFTLLGVVADAIAIVVLVRTQFYLAVTVGASLAIIAGIYLLVRRWGRPVDVRVVLAILILVAGAVAFAISIDRSANPGTNPDPPGPTPSSAPLISSAPRTPTPKPKLSTLYDGPVHLTPEYGVDLENNAAIGGNKQGPIVPLDLYLYPYGLHAATAHSSFFLIVDPGDASYAACDQRIKDNKGGTSALYSTDIVKDNQYCFQTDRGNTAWLRVGDFRLTRSDVGDYIDLKVKVWNQ